jgi:dihydroxyacetone kinase-like protein
MTLLSTVGGAAGPLYGTWFLRFGAAAAGRAALSLEDLEGALAAAVEGVRQRGKAEPGDKTMVDALEPALDALRRCRAEGGSAAAALRATADSADEGARATTPLVARKGRASYLGERSAGHQDPGATSSALLLRALAEVVAGTS